MCQVIDELFPVQAGVCPRFAGRPKTFVRQVLGVGGLEPAIRLSEVLHQRGGELLKLSEVLHQRGDNC